MSNPITPSALAIMLSELSIDVLKEKLTLPKVIDILDNIRRECELAHRANRPNLVNFEVYVKPVEEGTDVNPILTDVTDRLIDMTSLTEIHLFAEKYPNLLTVSSDTFALCDIDGPLYTVTALIKILERDVDESPETAMVSYPTPTAHTLENIKLLNVLIEELTLDNGKNSQVLGQIVMQYLKWAELDTIATLVWKIHCHLSNCNPKKGSN